MNPNKKRRKDPELSKLHEQSMVKNHLKSQKTALEKNRNELKAISMKAYMKSQFEFLGIQKPDIKLIYSNFRGTVFKPTNERELIEWISQLWDEVTIFAMNPPPANVFIIQVYLFVYSSKMNCLNLVVSFLIGLFTSRNYIAINFAYQYCHKALI